MALGKHGVIAQVEKSNVKATVKRSYPVADALRKAVEAAKSSK